jgi:Ser/Thr protein kinase RdoA (MazF antagonist)
MEVNPYLHTQHSAAAVLHLTVLHYELPRLASCQFYVRAMHDNYLITCGSSRYILRIYRNSWRSIDEIGFELDLLCYLSGKKASVASPLRTKNNELSFRLESPEGRRVAALFPYAEGHAPGPGISVAEGSMLGSEVARIHELGVGFSTPYTRHTLELPYLLDESIVDITPFLDQTWRNELGVLQGKLQRALGKLPKDTASYGICLGDVNPTNFHVNHENKLTLFDFDQCGYGYRAFEIGKFISSIHYSPLKHEIAKEFVAGYQGVRPLTNAERAAIPYFEMVAVIWVLAINVNNTDLIGYKTLERPFWERKFKILNVLDAALPAS